MHYPKPTRTNTAAHDTENPVLRLSAVVGCSCGRRQPPSDFKPRGYLEQRHTLTGTRPSRIRLGRHLRRTEHVGRRTDAPVPERLERQRAALGKPHRGDRRDDRLALLAPHQLRTRPVRSRYQAGRAASRFPGVVPHRDAPQRRDRRLFARRAVQRLRSRAAPLRAGRHARRHPLRGAARPAVRHRGQPLATLPPGHLPHSDPLRHGRQCAPIRTPRTDPDTRPSRIRLYRLRPHLLHRSGRNTLRVPSRRVPVGLSQGDARRDRRDGQRVEHHP
ncbi:unknown [Alistipes sp. CAG:268]|nr:unknown [Alistipes sp. CAG:268]